MQLLSASYTCPRCGKKNVKKVQASGFGVAIESYFACPKCNANIYLKYAFEFGPFATHVRVTDVKEFFPEMPVYHPRTKKKRSKT